LDKFEKMDEDKAIHLPWYAWPIAPFAFCAAVVVMIPLGILAIVSIPFYALFPDHHPHIYDCEATPRQRHRLEQWRAAYRELGVRGRLRRLWKKMKRQHTQQRRAYVFVRGRRRPFRER